MTNDFLLAEQVGLIGPSSRVGESHAAVQRFAELIRDDERKTCAKEASEFARKWWLIHCATNKHMETTRKAHDDFCALEGTINARGNQ